MATSVVMPALELAQETGKLLAWKKQEGEQVSKGEPLLEIETDKAVVEVEAPAHGVLAGISAHPGDDVPVGRIIAWVLAPGESVPSEGEQPVQTGRTGSAAARERAPAAATVGPPAAGARPGRLSPKARRLAQEHGIDLAQVRGTGEAGEILASDIEALIGNTSPVLPDGDAVEPVSQVWKLMAERTVQSWTSVPHFFLGREVEVSALVAHRERLKADGVTYTDLLVALVARVLQRHPRLNASWTASGIRIHRQVHVGVAVDAGNGVAIAVVREAHARSVTDLARQRQAIAERIRAGRATPQDLGGATFTLSNLGMRRVDEFTAIITPPQAAILAVGTIVDRVVAVNGAPAVRPTMHLMLSSDHRVVDGARAAAFMDELASAIGDPETWLM
jgi:pyruvate dehydrogenase E2 component (dihydrolipoamide acetyltransferase)